MISSPIRRHGRLLIGFVALWCVAVQATTPSTPTARVQDTIDKIIAILHGKNINREEEWERIGTIIDDRFDFQSMSQSVLATNWQTASKAEKRRFVEYFSQYLEDTYRTKIQAYTNQRVDYGKEIIHGTRATVETFIVTDKIRVPIIYKLKNNDSEWFAYDVVIEGVSLVNNYRNTFDAIVKSEGMDGLLRDLEGRISNYQATHAGVRPQP